MKLLTFAIHDSKAEVFTQPFYANAKGAAIRSFADAVNDGKTDFAKHPQDYTLFYLGEFDDNSGVFSPATPIVSLGNGATFLTTRDPRQLTLEA